MCLLTHRGGDSEFLLGMGKKLPNSLPKIVADLSLNPDDSRGCEQVSKKLWVDPQAVLRLSVDNSEFTQSLLRLAMDPYRCRCATFCRNLGRRAETRGRVWATVAVVGVAVISLAAAVYFFMRAKKPSKL